MAPLPHVPLAAFVLLGIVTAAVAIALAVTLTRLSDARKIVRRRDDRVNELLIGHSAHQDAAAEANGRANTAQEKLDKALLDVVSAMEERDEAVKALERYKERHETVVCALLKERDTWHENFLDMEASSGEAQNLLLIRIHQLMMAKRVVPNKEMQAELEKIERKLQDLKARSKIPLHAIETGKDGVFRIIKSPGVQPPSTAPKVIGEVETGSGVVIVEAEKERLA